MSSETARDKNTPVRTSSQDTSTDKPQPQPQPQKPAPRPNNMNVVRKDADDILIEKK